MWKCFPFTASLHQNRFNFCVLLVVFSLFSNRIFVCSFSEKFIFSIFSLIFLLLFQVFFLFLFFYSFCFWDWVLFWQCWPLLFALDALFLLLTFSSRVNSRNERTVEANDCIAERKYCCYFRLLKFPLIWRSSSLKVKKKKHLLQTQHILTRAK